jgi:hypothetical protein
MHQTEIVALIERARERRVCPADQMMNDDAPAAAREQPIFARRSLSLYLSSYLHRSVRVFAPRRERAKCTNVRVHAAASNRHALAAD